MIFRTVILSLYITFTFFLSNIKNSANNISLLQNKDQSSKIFKKVIIHTHIYNFSYKSRFEFSSSLITKYITSQISYLSCPFLVPLLLRIHIYIRVYIHILLIHVYTPTLFSTLGSRIVIISSFDRGGKTDCQSTGIVELVEKKSRG